MKKGILIVSVIIVAAIAVLLVMRLRRPEKMMIKLPSGEVVEAVKMKMDPGLRRSLLATTVEGKVEDIQLSYSHKYITKLVLVANNGQMIILFNPEFVNKLRLGGYIGKMVKLKGQKHGRREIFGKQYDSLWIEEIVK